MTARGRKAPDATAEEPAAVWLDIDELREWTDNPRINDHAVDDVVDSIERFGFGEPLLARKANKEIIAGHTRIKAARKLGLKRLPVRLLDLTEREAHLLALADNKLGEKADWSLPELHALLKEYEPPEIELAGWTSDELEKMANDLLAGAGGANDGEDVEEDDVPEPPKEPVTKPGDLWTLGEHRLYCGDAAAVESWARVMRDGELLDLVFTDPPYGVDYVGKTKDALPVHNDEAEGLSELLARAFDQLVARCRPGGVWYVCAPPGPQMLDFCMQLSKRAIWRQTIIWIKDQFVLGHSDFHYQSEVIFYGWKPGAAHRPPPDRKQTNVWPFDRPRTSREHPTMKPVKLVAHALGMSSHRGELVGDAFGGSGTVLVAAEQLGRRTRLIELSPAYCDVIVERWQNLTGGKAERRSAA